MSAHTLTLTRARTHTHTHTHTRTHTRTHTHTHTHKHTHTQTHTCALPTLSLLPHFIPHSQQVSPNGRTFGRYWKQIAAITLSCTTLFVYEFCQRYKLPLFYSHSCQYTLTYCTGLVIISLHSLVMAGTPF